MYKLPYSDDVCIGTYTGSLPGIVHLSSLYGGYFLCPILKKGVIGLANDFKTVLSDSKILKRHEFKVYKTDEKMLVFGWASIAIRTDGEQILDLQNDIIDPEDLEEAAYEYVLNFRDGGEEHNPDLRKKARLIESCVFTKEKMQAMGIPENIVPEGWWIGFKVDDDEAWEKIKNGTYQMFSIEGTATREPVEGGE